MPLPTYTQPDTVSSSDVLAAADHNAQIVESIKHFKKIMDSYTVVYHEEASGVDGGTVTAATWTTRPLSGIKANTNAANLVAVNSAADTIFLNAGVWYIDVRASSFYEGGGRLRLYNQSDATVDLEGVNERSGSLNASGLTMMGIIKITAGKFFRIEHFATRTQATNGMGEAYSTGTNERYLVATLICLDND